jgi:uncharacterized protein DUF7033
LVTDLRDEPQITDLEAAAMDESGLASLGGASGLTPAARRYALKELASRAGVAAELFQSWRISVREEETLVWVEAGTEKCIRFPHVPQRFWDRLATREYSTVRAAWMAAPPEALRRLVPDLVVPFAHERRADLPLFVPVDRNGIHCSLDLLASILLTLARFEEGGDADRDAHGRFPASSSLAVRDHFLDRPVVDECGLAFEQALRSLLPGWQPVERRLRVKLSHDVDWIGIPSSLPAILLYAAYLVRHHPPSVITRELLRWVGGLEPTCLRLVREIVRLSLDRGLDSAVYWMAAAPGRRDPGYDPHSVPVTETIAWLRDQGVEMGVHPGYHTFGSPKQLRHEVQALRQVLGESWLGGRQHYLRWSPESWHHWEMCGLAYDSTVGYADRIGFRAGTCIPYRPWLFSLDRAANLLEIPLLVMDGTLLHYMGLSPEQSLDAVQELVARCRAVGGVFTLLWHNSSLLDPGAAALYRQLLDSLAGSERFDWRTPASGVDRGRVAASAGRAMRQARVS